MSQSVSADKALRFREPKAGFSKWTSWLCARDIKRGQTDRQEEGESGQRGRQEERIEGSQSEKT